MDATEAENVILIHEPGGGRAIPLGPGGTVRVKVEGAQSGNSLLLYEFSMPPRTAGPPLHMHPNWGEAFYVLDGEVTFLIDGEEHTVPKGGCTFVAGRVPHTFWNAADTPATNLTILTPSGLEHYFDDVSEALAQGQPGESIHAFMEKHGIATFPGGGSAYEALDE